MNIESSDYHRKCRGEVIRHNLTSSVNDLSVGLSGAVRLRMVLYVAGPHMLRRIALCFPASATSLAKNYCCSFSV